MKRVFLVYAELAAASEKWKAEGYAGGFVVVVVPADDIRTALDLAERALKEDGYEVLDIDKAMEFEPDEWEHDKDIGDIAKQSAVDGDIRYTPFEVWGH